MDDAANAGDDDFELVFDAALEREVRHGAAVAGSGEADFDIAFFGDSEEVDLASVGAGVGLDIDHGVFHLGIEGTLFDRLGGGSFEEPKQLHDFLRFYSGEPEPGNLLTWHCAL